MRLTTSRLLTLLLSKLLRWADGQSGGIRRRAWLNLSTHASIESLIFSIILNFVNEVTEDMDKRRMMWSVGDMVNGRPPLTRWRPEFKSEAEKTMEKMKF